jgi:tRNA-modifying protein YgfZ
MTPLRIDRLDGDLAVEGRPVRLRKPSWMGEDVLPSSTD